MFDIYIRNFNQNGTIVTQETLMQTIPASSENALKLVSPVVKCEMGSAEGLDFSIETGTQFYDAFLQMKTYIRIVYDGDTIFYGRVLTIDNNGLRGTRKIRCEGPYSFLLDSPVAGVQEKRRSEITIQNYMSQLINNHNMYVENDPDKKFLLGEIPGQYSSAVSEAQKIKNDKKKYGSDSWTDTKGALEDLRSHYGGYFRTRTTTDGTYLDWMNHYFNASVNAQTVEIGKNILDINDVTEIDNIFTAIIPIGKNMKASSKNTEDTGLYIDGYRTDIHGSGKILRVADITKVYSDEELNVGYHKAENYKNAYDHYGMIVKTVTFNDSTTKEKLFNDACEWIKNNYQGEVTKFTVKAIDMHQIGQDTTKIMVGDQVNIIYPVGKEDGSVDKRSVKLTCLSISYDLYRPENNSYTFGIPANMLTKTYGLNKSTKSVSSGVSKPSPTPVGTDVGEEVPWIDLVRGWLQRHKVHYNGPKPYKDEYGSAYQPETDPYMYLSPVDSGDLRTYLVHGHRHMTGADKDGNIIDIDENEKVTPEMKYQGGIYWVPTMDSVDYVNEAVIYKYKVIEWVQYEYGYDLRTMLPVKAPAMSVDEDGNIIITKEIYDPDLEEVQAIRRMYYDNASSTIEIYDQGGDNQVIKAYLDENNNWTYWYEDKDGNIQPTSIRDLSIIEIDNQNKIGWVVQENGQGDLEFANPGEMTMAIEKFAGGEMVVTRIAGEQTYIGNTKTQRLTSVSLEHMDSVTGDFEYVPDETDPHLQVIRLNSGAGMRNYHAVKKMKKPLPDPDHPENPENWEYSYIDDPLNPGQKILEMGEYGVYDNNTLVGGIVSKILNDGTVHTKVKGEVVDIESGTVRIGDFSDILSFPTRADFPEIGDPTKIYIDELNNQPYRWVYDPQTGHSGYGQINHTLHTLNYAQHGINTTLSMNVGDLYSISGDLQSVASDMDRRVYIIEGSAIWKDRDHIVNVAGEYEIIENPDGTRTLRIKSGGGLRIQKDGTDFGLYMTDPETGDTVLTGGIITKKLNDQGDTYTQIKGKYIDITADDIAKFGIIDPETGTLTGGVITEKLKDGTVSTKISGDIVDITANSISKFGIIDPETGTLTAGVIAEKLNDQGDTYTRIKGKYVDIQSAMVRVGNSDVLLYSSRSAFPSTGNAAKMYVAKDTKKVYIWDPEQSPAQYVETNHTYSSAAALQEGLVAEKATITELNAQKARIDSLESDYIKTQDLEATIGKIETINVKNISANPYTNSSCNFHDFHGNDYYAQHYYIYTGGGGGAPVTKVDVRTGVRDIQIVQNGNTYTLQKRDYDDTGWTNVGSFSRAVTGFTGSWSGGIYSMTPIPQGSPTYTIGLTSSQNLWLDVILQNGKKPTQHASPLDKYIDVPLELVQRSGQGQEIRTGAYMTKMYDATPVWQAGFDAGSAGASQEVTDFITSSPANAQYTAGSKTYTNNSDGYYLEGSGSDATAVIVVDGSIKVAGGDTQNKYHFLLSTPTKLYKKGHRDGWGGAYETVGLNDTTAKRLGYNESIFVAAQAKATSDASSKTDVASRYIYGPFGEIKSFDTTAPSGESYTAGTTTYTNNSDGYYLSGSGNDAHAFIVVKSTFNLDNASNPRDGTSYLHDAPTKLYKKGYSDGNSSVSRRVTFPSSGATGTFSGSTPASTALSGWNPVKLSGGSISGQTTNVYRYIKFYVDGIKRSIYFP